MRGLGPKGPLLEFCTPVKSILATGLSYENVHIHPLISPQSTHLNGWSRNHPIHNCSIALKTVYEKALWTLCVFEFVHSGVCSIKHLVWNKTVGTELRISTDKPFYVENSKIAGSIFWWVFTVSIAGMLQRRRC